jgi:hypothetical protein
MKAGRAAAQNSGRSNVMRGFSMTLFILLLNICCFLVVAVFTEETIPGIKWWKGKIVPLLD